MKGKTLHQNTVNTTITTTNEYSIQSGDMLRVVSTEYRWWARLIIFLGSLYFGRRIPYEKVEYLVVDEVSENGTVLTLKSE